MLLPSCSLQNDCSVSVVHMVGESTIQTEAASNDITETAYPLHDKSATGMFGFVCCCISTFYCATAVDAMHSIARRKPSVCLSVRPSVKRVDCHKQKKLVPTFLRRMKEHLSYFSDTKNHRVVGGDHLVPEILGQTDPVRAKMLIFNRYSLA